MVNVRTLVAEQWVLIVARRVDGPVSLATLMTWTKEARVAFGAVRLMRAAERLERKGWLVLCNQRGPKGGRLWRVRGDN